MAIEVEQKYWIDDLPSLEHRLADMGMVGHEPVLQIDCYFSHPGRNFASTDEALRLRRVGEHNYITYKGPKLDTTTKTRREIELEFALGLHSADDMASLLQALGFAPVAEVRKHRMHSTIRWQNWEVGVALDDVSGLGRFVELEIMATQADLESAKDCLASLAKQLGLANAERRSYLELLLTRPDST